MINSPRSLRACEQLGVDPSELYQLTPEKFKEKYPELINANDEDKREYFTGLFDLTFFDSKFESGNLRMAIKLNSEIKQSLKNFLNMLKIGELLLSNNVIKS